MALQACMHSCLRVRRVSRAGLLRPCGSICTAVCRLLALGARSIATHATRKRPRADAAARKVPRSANNGAFAEVTSTVTSASLHQLAGPRFLPYDTLEAAASCIASSRLNLHCISVAYFSVFLPCMPAGRTSRQSSLCACGMPFEPVCREHFMEGPSTVLHVTESMGPGPAQTTVAKKFRTNTRKQCLQIISGTAPQIIRVHTLSPPQHGGTDPVARYRKAVTWIGASRGKP